jgi:hypothetical protein
MPVIPSPQEKEKEHPEFNTSLGCITRPCLKKTKTKQRKTKNQGVGM